jgi:hypothetical protein
MAGAVDQHFGGVTAFVLSILWVGRHHWALVLRQAWRGHAGEEPHGRFLSYRFAFWALVGCVVVMVGWLCVAGCTVLGAINMVVLLLVLMVVITRIIAESGLMHGQLQVPINYPWQLAAMYGFPLVSPVKTFYFASMLQAVHFDFREPAQDHRPNRLRRPACRRRHARHAKDRPKYHRAFDARVAGWVCGEFHQHTADGISLRLDAGHTRPHRQ